MKEKFLELLNSRNRLIDFHNFIKDRNYEGIFNEYGKSIYQLFAPYEYQRDDIKRLLKNNDFENLRQKYGNLYHVKVSAFNNFEKLKNNVEKLKLDKNVNLKISAIGLSSLMLLSTACSNQRENVNNDGYVSTVTAATINEKDGISESVAENVITETNTTVETTITSPETSIETTITSPETSIETTTTSPETTIEDLVPVFELKDASRIEEDNNLSTNEITNYNLFLDSKDYFENNDKIDNILQLENAHTLDPNTVIYYDMPFLAGISLYNQDVANENLTRYQDYLNEYNTHLENYSEYIRSLDLNDLDTIAKVMDDIWSSVEDGFCYADGTKPKYDIYGMFRIDVDRDESAVKCRNLADDFTAKMNAINPEYEAINIIVNTDSKYYSSGSFGDINVNFSSNTDDYALDKYLDPAVVTTPSVIDDHGNQASYQIYLLDNEHNLSQKKCLINVRGEDPNNRSYVGDHMVSMISIKDENTHELKYHLIVDPTNVNISVLKDGKIYVLSNYDYEGLELSACGNIMHHSFDDSIAIADAVIDSRARSEQISVETLKDLYGVDALNKSLASIREKCQSYEEYKTR